MDSPRSALLFFGLALAGCSSSVGDAADAAADPVLDGAPPADAFSDSAIEGARDMALDGGGGTDGAAPTSGLTADFRAWLALHGYGGDDFARDDLDGGSFGGRPSPDGKIVNVPVIFIHGNSDKALGSVAPQSGFRATRDYFLTQGYSGAELYATTWGPADATQASAQSHTRSYVTRVRRFIEAVKAYTGASKISIVSHSMGVTLARKAILGGASNDPDHGGAYNLGTPLTTSVDVFVGISGANLGLVSCFLAGPIAPTCDAKIGLYPGTAVLGAVTGRSAFLDELLASKGYEGAHRYTIYSTVDELIGYGGVVYGQYTSALPGQDGEKVYMAAPYGHFGTKDQTADLQYQMVKNHIIP